LLGLIEIFSPFLLDGVLLGGRLRTFLTFRLLRLTFVVCLHSSLLLPEILRAEFSNVRRELLRGNVVELLVVDEHFWRQPFQDPGMPQRLVGGHPCVRIPVQAPLNKVDEILIITLENVVEGLGARLLDLALGVGH